MLRYSINSRLSEKKGEAKQQKGIIAWIFLMIFSYFIVIPLGQISTVATTDFRLYDLVFILGALFVILPNLKAIFAQIKQTPWLRNFFQLVIWLLLGLLIVFVFKGIERVIVAGARVARFTFYGFTAAVIVTFVKEKKTLHRLVWLFFLLSFFEAVLSYLQYIDIVPNLFPDRWSYYYEMPTGTLGPHHLQMGIIAAMGVCIGIALAFHHRSIINRIFVAIALGFLVFAAFAVESRTGWVGIALGTFYLVIRLNRKLSLDMIFMFIILFLGLFLFFRNLGATTTFQIVDLFTNKFYNPLQEEGIIGLSDTRYALAMDVPRVLIENPWVLISGTGTQNAVVALRYGSALHNNYLHVLIEGGLLGLFLYLRMIWSIFWQSNQNYQKARGALPQVISLGFQAAFVVIIFSNLYNETFYLQYATFSLAGQIMALAAVCLHPVWIEEN